jgi:FkbM family methyltransferase
MKVLLDVGAHFGQTTEIALNPVWGFDQIHAFEPSTNSFKKLHQIKSKRLKCYRYGLFSKDIELPLIGSGQVGASVYDKKIQSIESQTIEMISLRSVNDWIVDNVDFSEAQVFLKLNCEGSEVDILHSLIDSKLINNFDSIYIDFDIRKIPGHEHRQRQIEEELEKSSVRYSTWENLFDSLTEVERNIPYFTFTKWLESECKQVKFTRLSMIRYKLRLHSSWVRILRILGSRITPRFVKRVLHRAGV